MNKTLKTAIEKLGKEFETLDWTYHDYNSGNPNDKIFFWPGKQDEDIMICVLKAKQINELFHRQDFFFFNYAYLSNYNALSAKYDNLITVHENECYIGQPYSGYALRGNSDSDIIIVGVLIQKSTFFREYLPTLSSDTSMFRFFLDPQTNEFSDEFIHLSFDKCSPVRKLLEMMITEYADRKSDTQMILKPMVLTLLMQIARRYRLENTNTSNKSLSAQIIQYIGDHSESITLKEIADHFSYHPNYISTLLHKETGKTFSELILDKRMERAVILLKETNLSIEAVSAMLGYNNSSNFYKAFRAYYHKSPRDYTLQSKESAST